MFCMTISKRTQEKIKKKLKAVPFQSLLTNFVLKKKIATQIRNYKIT